jgi:membrane protease YdiL (CAAX protease family)
MWPSMMGYGYPMQNWASNVPYPTFFILCLLGIIIWFWTLLDCSKRDFKNNIEKAIWILAIIFAPMLAIIAYFIVIRSANPHGILKNGGK